VMPSKKGAIRETFESLLIAVALALFARTFVFQAFKIPSGSMERNLLIGDHLIVNKMIFSPAVTGLERALLPQRSIARGDIIVFKSPEEPARDMIKRVIGLPGERLEVRDKKVYINGARIDEPYAQFIASASSIPNDSVLVSYGPVTVPSGQYFMMGDNRDNSQDSRFWGFLPATYIKGDALFIYFSTGDGTGGIQWGRLGRRVR
jgi:signal peptidase I